MRTRSRTKTTSVTGLKNQNYVRTYDPPSPLPPVVTNSGSKITRTLTERTETIVDKVQVRPGVYVDPKTQKWRRIRYPSFKSYDLPPGAARLFGQNRPFRAVQPCTHTKVVITPNQSGVFLADLASHVSNWTNTWKLSFDNPLIGAADLTGNSSADVATMLNSATASYSAGAYRKIDWFALAHDFNEACESFTKNKFLAGEALYECQIFVSAFKLITNPASAISTLAKFIRNDLSPREAKKYRKMTLGEFGRSIKGAGKKAVNAHLSYDFAVKPAIEDVKATILAHDFVSQRMKFLSLHAGSYVPIRVRQKIFADVSNTELPTDLGVGVRSRLYRQCVEKSTTGVISGWGRVRQDLDWSDTWSAYLQYFGVGKLIGLAWELIPFSFVVDWVTDAQEYIDNTTRLRTGGPFIGLRGISASLKETTTEQISLVPGYYPTLSTYILGNNPRHIATKKTSVYSRYTTIPETSGLVDFSNLGLFHYTKLAELAVQLFVK